MRLSYEGRFRNLLRPVLYGFCIFAALLIASAVIYATCFGPPGTDRTYETFVVSPDQSITDVADALYDQGFVRYPWTFRIAYGIARTEQSVRPGGYQLTRSQDALSVTRTLAQAPYLTWLTIPNGLRKEQVAELIAKSLSWTKAQQDAWLAAAQKTGSNVEGRYFPDTYLIPSDQAPDQIVARLQARFEEETAAYMAEAEEKGYVWDEIINLASLIEREAAKNDKELVSGILWNRLNRGMLLQVDATLQYAIGTEDNRWWSVPKSEDKYVESPFNTYQHDGLPPHPIASPSVESIEAALNPQKTSCLFYLHDSKGRIHCSPTYKGHLANVNRYLR